MQQSEIVSTMMGDGEMTMFLVGAFVTMEDDVVVGVGVSVCDRNMM